MVEMIYIAKEAEGGGYYARAVAASIFRWAETSEKLMLMIKDAIDCHSDDEETRPKLVNLDLCHH